MGTGGGQVVCGVWYVVCIWSDILSLCVMCV